MFGQRLIIGRLSHALATVPFPLIDLQPVLSKLFNYPSSLLRLHFVAPPQIDLRILLRP